MSAASDKSKTPSAGATPATPSSATPSSATLPAAPGGPSATTRWRHWLGIGRWYLREVARQLVEHDCLSKAGALTYTTLFAVVPMMTVTFTIFSVLPEFEDVGAKVQSYVFDNFVPASSAAVQDKLVEFTERAQGLTGVGFLFLFVTAFMMLITIEKAFNRIWNVQEPRHGLPRFLLYWGVLSLGPPLIAGGVFISLYLLTLPLLTDIDTLGISQVLLPTLPLLFTAAGFTVLYVAVPNCPVPLAHAMVGGILTMLAFELAKWVFATAVANANFEPIYGTFAAVPLFLVWLYLVWVVILSGAIVVRTLSLSRDVAGDAQPALLHCARVIQTLYGAHLAGTTVSEEELSAAVPMSASQRQRVFAALTQMRLIGTTEDERWFLSRSLKGVTLWELYQRLPDDLTLSQLEASDSLPELVEPLRALLQFGSNHMAVSLESVFATLQAGASNANSPGKSL